MVSEELKLKLQQITQQEVYKVIVSKPSDKAAKYRKIEIEKKSSGYQAAAYTQKQVFHEKIEPDGLLDYLSGRVGSEFLQLNAWDGNSEYMLLISKKGKVTDVKSRQRVQQKCRNPITVKRNICWKREP